MAEQTLVERLTPQEIAVARELGLDLNALAKTKQQPAAERSRTQVAANTLTPEEVAVAANTLTPEEVAVAKQLGLEVNAVAEMKQRLAAARSSLRST